MASYTVAATGAVAVHAKTLTASTVDTVTFNGAVGKVRVINLDGAAAIYFTVDGSTPTVGGANTFVLPAAISADDRDTPTDTDVVKLISAGTPTYSVETA